MIRKKTKKLTQLIFRGGLASLLFSSHNQFLLGGDYLLSVEEDREEVALELQPQQNCVGHCINFNDVPVIEFIRFVSKISSENFIFDNRDLNFNISLSTGKAVSPEIIVAALIQLLKKHGLTVSQDSGYYVIHNNSEDVGEGDKIPQKHLEQLLASNAPNIDVKDSERYEFFVYKLQYHEGPEIEESLKKIAADLRSQPDAPIKLINAIQSLQWVKATNSLLCSADAETLQKLNKLVESLDMPLRQVFIEVLVIETDVKKGMEFGLQWGAGGQFSNRVGFGVGNFSPSHGQHGTFASTMQGINATNTPTGLGQIPLVPGFDLGVIGDIIMHKGKSYLSLGSLVSALQVDGSSTIVLNQKIITQDNKNSTIFVGDNIPFTGSVVQTVGQSQQTTANIEYRDIGVSLSITPRLGEDDIITLSLNQEITESVDNEPMNNNTTVNGIRTTKTNMATHVHVPDKHFLVLSGMIRNSKAQHKAGLPCLGGLPLIGAAFSKTKKHDEKRNIIIFVRPHIIRSFEDYQKLTESQEEVFRNQANPTDFDAAIDVLPKESKDQGRGN
jgi:type II secretory pathway component GspD/PulD (secretin)